MNEYINLKGYLKVETLDAKTREVLDVWEDPNLILTLARQNMANLLSGLALGSPINKFTLGDRGNILSGTTSADILAPKSETEEFTDAREELFAEEVFVGTETYTVDDISQIVAVVVGDIILYTTATNGIQNNHYRSKVVYASVDLAIEDFTDTVKWESLGTTNGYAYEVTFDPSVADGNGDLLGDDIGTNININVDVSDDTFKTTYVYEIPQLFANGSGAVIYTEAGMYFHDGVDYKLFSMRTFPAKVKDNSVILKITWSIIF